MKKYLLMAGVTLALLFAEGASASATTGCPGLTNFVISTIVSKGDWNGWKPKTPADRNTLRALGDYIKEKNITVASGRVANREGMVKVAAGKPPFCNYNMVVIEHPQRKGWDVMLVK